MKWISIFSAGFLFLNASVSFSQHIVSDRNIPFSALNDIVTDETVYIDQIPNNGILVVQNGSRNVVDVNVMSTNQNLSYTQTGNDNFISSRILAESTIEQISQFGRNNGSFHFANSPHENTSVQLNQFGDNLHFEMHGSNSIGNNLQFNMSGNSKTIIVRNFK